ncbi:sigma-70 family RNA polymerase sigma factor [Enterobacteriaceae bacterium 89]|nr:sigma-70 family RNA polymerase sigma factor [Enterobacteriaceae bacterium 89]
MKSATGQSLLVSALNACRSRVTAFIRGRTAVREDADDILQEITYQLMKVEQPVENVAAWLYRAARNEITDRARKKSEVPFSGLFSQDEENDYPEEEIAEALFSTPQTPEGEYLSSLLWEEVNEAIAELPLAQRDVFEQTELYGLSYKEIAEMTGDSVQALLSRKHKAVAYLRERLRTVYDELTDE